MDRQSRLYAIDKNNFFLLSLKVRSVRLYGLIGKSLSHSFSPAFFHQKFRSEGIEAEYRLFELEHIDQFERLKTLPDLYGLNVTIPYKQAVLPYLDACSEEVLAIGAANTLVRYGSEWKGYNTDTAGFERSLRSCIKQHGVWKQARALVLGSGGASLAVRHVLKAWGWDYAVVSRSSPIGTLSYEDLSADLVRDFLLIVNTTPLGMYPNTDTCPDIPYAALGKAHLLLDLVYNPPVTRFMRLGAECGAFAANGLQMLREQALAAWALWSQSKL